MKKTWLTILIIIILAIVAYFVYSYRSTLIPAVSESIIQKLESQNTSDEVVDIEKDLNATSLEGLNKELSDIERELQSTGI